VLFCQFGVFRATAGAGAFKLNELSQTLDLSGLKEGKPNLYGWALNWKDN
jgi:hypothetical protein